MQKIFASTAVLQRFLLLPRNHAPGRCPGPAFDCKKNGRNLSVPPRWAKWATFTARTS